MAAIRSRWRISSISASRSSSRRLAYSGVSVRRVRIMTLSLVLARRLEWLAGAGCAQQAQALQVVTPVEVVDAVIVVGELHGVFLPEPELGAAVTEVGELEPEGAVLPGVMAGHAAPAELPLLVQGDDLHHRVEIPGERPVDSHTDRCLLGSQLGRPPARHLVRLGQRRPDWPGSRIDVHYMVDRLHRAPPYPSPRPMAPAGVPVTAASPGRDGGTGPRFLVIGPDRALRRGQDRDRARTCRPI